jgi:pilus assembly protein FimV
MLRALLVAGLLPASAHALGFGDIRLNSALNSPLNAEIDITASADELATLSAGIAGRDTFSRNGLDYPALLATAKVSVERAADGHSLLRVRTPDPVTEPFLTMLIEVSHAHGRLVREYTVLLDPPVLASQASAAPVSAPVVSPAAAASSGSTSTNTSNSSAAGAASAATAVTAGSGNAGPTYQVHRGDTLNNIASRLYPGSDRRSALVALYQANPSAFEGNMNVLRSGAMLTVPSAAAVSAIGPSAASAEVAQQTRAWSGAGRLRLVPPSSDAGSAAGATGASRSGNGAEVSALQQKVQSLEQQLQESKRLLDVRNAELAAIQNRSGQKTPSAATPPATTPVPAPVAPPAAKTPETSTASSPPPVEVVTPPAAEAPAPPKPKPLPHIVPEAPAASGSIVDTLVDNWKALLGGLLVLGLGAFGFLRWQKSRAESSGASDFDRPVTESFQPTESTSQTLPFRVLPDERSDAILVEETGSHSKPNIPSVAPSVRVGAAGAPKSSTSGIFESVGATQTQTAMSMDQGDSLAEADFHMAYGLYDQAAELVKQAITREPARRDLKVKLLEVYFVWGNKDEFLAQARDLAATRGESAPGEWEKILIMGRQIAAGDPLFAGDEKSSSLGAGGIDLNLEGGHNRVDFNVLGEPTMTDVSSDSVDLDFGAATDNAGDAAQANTASSGVDFVFEDPEQQSGTATVAQQSFEQPTTRLPRPDNAPTAEATVMMSDPEGPTAEMPELPAGDHGTIRQKLDAATALLSVGAPGEQTAELAIDDLGLDIGTMDVPTVHETTVSDQLALSMVLDAGGANADTAERTALTDIGSSGEHLADMTSVIAIEPTMTQMMLTQERTNEVLSLDDEGEATADVGNKPPNGATTDQTASMRALTPPLDSDEPPTMSEVGTKLDLARAYMDMGDPEGARSILDEVIHEGSASQKQEARRLMDSLPG